MKTIFPNENRCNDQINLKITSGYVELNVKTILYDENNEKNCETKQSGKIFIIVKYLQHSSGNWTHSC